MIDRTFAILAVSAATMTACTPIIRHHGYVPPVEDLALVQTGKTSRDELPGLIGRPSAQGVLSGAAWYYVGSKWRHYGAAAPAEISREVVAISFNDAGIVTNIERFGLLDGQVVVLSRRVTEQNTAGISLVRQLMGSVTNFDPGQFLD